MDADFMKKVMYLPPVKLKSFKYMTKTGIHTEAAKKGQIKHKATRLKNLSLVHKEEQDLQVLKKLLTSPRRPQIDITYYFDPAKRSQNVLWPLIYTPIANNNGQSERQKNSSETPKSTLTKSFNETCPVLVTEFAKDPVGRNSTLIRKPSQTKFLTQYEAPKEKAPLFPQRKYDKLYGRIVDLFNDTIKKKSDMLYSDMIQTGLEPINFQKSDEEKMHILFKSRRLELPKHAKAKFSQTTQRKFMLQNNLAKPPKIKK